MKAPVFKAPTFKAPTVKRPTLPSLAPAKDPLKGVDPNISDIEEAAEAEITALQQGFRDRAAQEAARYADATDTGFYSVVVFDNRAQCEAWLVGIGKLGKGDLYLDGRDLAALMNIPLPPNSGPRQLGKVDGVLAGMARSIGSK